MIALRKIPVSVAYPSVALSYALVAILGHFLFGETFGVKQMGGIALIIGGWGSSFRVSVRQALIQAAAVSANGPSGMGSPRRRRPTIRWL
jgi:drug/metabolite transporter (DMT)-like permease